VEVPDEADPDAEALQGADDRVAGGRVLPPATVLADELDEGRDREHDESDLGPGRRQLEPEQGDHPDQDRERVHHRTAAAEVAPADHDASVVLARVVVRQPQRGDGGVLHARSSAPQVSERSWR
jgi:hypothetical protein